MDDQERVMQFRRDQAPTLEREAITAEVHAEQWKKASDKFHRTEWKAVAADRANDAKGARIAADKLHQLAGTKPEEFYSEIATTLRLQADNLRNELVILKERAEHPDIYARDGSNPETLKFDLFANEALHDALLNKADELEALIEDESEAANTA